MGYQLKGQDLMCLSFQQTLDVNSCNHIDLDLNYLKMFKIFLKCKLFPIVLLKDLEASSSCTTILQSL